jgi:hypothetical protein
MSFKKTPTIEELKEEVEAIQHQVVSLNAASNALRKQLNNHPAVIELSVLKSKWWVKLLYKG